MMFLHIARRFGICCSVLLFVLLGANLSAQVNTHLDYTDLPAKVRTIRVEAQGVTGDSTELWRPYTNIAIGKIVVRVEKEWTYSDSLKIGTMGHTSLTPGNLWGSDKTTDRWGGDTTGAPLIYVQDGGLYASAQPVMLYHPAPLGTLNGTLTIHIWYYEVGGSAVATQRPGGWYDDLLGTATNLRINPGLSYPEFNYTSSGYMFRNAQADTIWVILQVPHAFSQDDGWIYPHVHWVQEDTGTVMWKALIKIENNGYPTSAAVSVQNQIAEFPYTSGSITQITDLTAVDAQDDAAVPMKLSAIITVKLIRLGSDPLDSYPRAALMKSFDIHIRKDQHGSPAEYFK